MQVSFSSPAAARSRISEVTRLLFKSARVQVEFTRTSWLQLIRNRTSSVPAFIQAINIKANLALYIAAHEDRGVFMDTECQEICYQPGMYFIIRQVGSTWYITDVIVSAEDTDYAPVYLWTRIKCGCDVLAARVLIRWRRLTKRLNETEPTGTKIAF